jgi:hypothetical protein
MNTGRASAASVSIKQGRRRTLSELTKSGGGGGGGSAFLGRKSSNSNFRRNVSTPGFGRLTK